MKGIPIEGVPESQSLSVGPTLPGRDWEKGNCIPGPHQKTIVPIKPTNGSGAIRYEGNMSLSCTRGEGDTWDRSGYTTQPPPRVL